MAVNFDTLKKGTRIYEATKYVQWHSYGMPKRYCDSFVVRQVMKTRIRLYGVDWLVHRDELQNWFLSREDSYAEALKDVNHQLKSIKGECECDKLRLEKQRLEKAITKRTGNGNYPHVNGGKRG